MADVSPPSIEDRLDRIEAALETLTSTLEEYRPLLDRVRDRIEGRRWAGLRSSGG